MEEYFNIINQLRDELNQRWCKNRLLLMECEEKSQELLLLRGKLEGIRQQENLLKNNMSHSFLKTMDSSLFNSNNLSLKNLQRNATEIDRTIAFLQKQLQQKEKNLSQTHSNYERLYNDYKSKIESLLINKNYPPNYLQQLSEASEIKRFKQDNSLLTTLKSLNSQHKEELESLEKKREQLEALFNNQSNEEENNLLFQEKNIDSKNTNTAKETSDEINHEIKNEIKLDCQPDIIDISSPGECSNKNDISFEESETKMEVVKSDLNKELVNTQICLRNYSLNQMQNEIIHVNEPPAKKSKLDLTSGTYPKEAVETYCYSLLKNDSPQSKLELTNSESFFGLKENQPLDKFTLFSQGNDEDINSPFTFKFG